MDVLSAHRTHFHLRYFVVRVLANNSGRLSCAKHSSRKSSATHSYQCMQCFPVFNGRYSCQCWGFLKCARMLMHATARGICTGTVRESRESAMEGDSGRKNPLPGLGFEPASALRLAFQWDAYQLRHSLLLWPCDLKTIFCTHIKQSYWYKLHKTSVKDKYVPHIAIKFYKRICPAYNNRILQPNMSRI